uniref:Uncharacterized protein n=1 Tax=Mola mola TaxID=94237 RepID=A0A3Q4B570_MOLML
MILSAVIWINIVILFFIHIFPSLPFFDILQLFKYPDVHLYRTRPTFRFCLWRSVRVSLIQIADCSLTQHDGNGTPAPASPSLPACPGAEPRSCGPGRPAPWPNLTLTRGFLPPGGTIKFHIT